MSGLNEADTCRKYILPRLSAWEEEPRRIAEQYPIDAGRILTTGRSPRRRRKKFADYLLCYDRDTPLAVVEAKRKNKSPDAGLQQAKAYAELLDLKFAYSTNGKGIVEFDYTTGAISELDTFPSPTELWRRLKGDEGLSDELAEKLLTPFNLTSGKRPRYYQRIAINRVIKTILQGQDRLLLTMATGTGKTSTAFQICWKLWSMGWNCDGEYRKPRILYLADRSILVDDPMQKDFFAFKEDIVHKIQGEALKGREIYFALYQSLSNVYQDYSEGYFDLIVVDECHRGSARDESQWREILDYFQPSVRLGLTATPKRDVNVDTYNYFGDPLYTYSLQQGIEDGFLAPYRVYRVSTTWDTFGWRPTPEEIDRYGRSIPDEEYQTGDFERIVSLKARTEAIARHITDYLKRTDRFAKTIVFCVDQPHAQEMVVALNNLNTDLTRDHPNYVCRITSDEAEWGQARLYEFKDPEQDTPVIAVTSKLLSTGVDVPTCKNVILVRVIRSMVEFKQIVGRGTRVEEDYGKLTFTILDYTNSTRLFADPGFDDEPDVVTEAEINEDGDIISESVEVRDLEEPEDETGPAYPNVDEERFLAGDEADDTPTGFTSLPDDEDDGLPRKYYFDQGQVEIAGEILYELAPNGNRLRAFKLTYYKGERVRVLCRSAMELRERWMSPEKRSDLIAQLVDQGIDFEDLREVTHQTDADPFDLLCHLAFDLPPMTYKQRAERLKRQRQDFFDQYGEQARAVLDKMLEKYAEGGPDYLNVPDAFKVREFEQFGNTSEIATLFGGAANLRDAVNRLQSLLYSA
ncbi:MAG: EcoAI/FtnUII family type I restriction enzme subunit R [Leptolyngbyaceae cyanobacterium]